MTRGKPSAATDLLTPVPRKRCEATNGEELLAELQEYFDDLAENGWRVSRVRTPSGEVHVTFRPPVHRG